MKQLSEFELIRQRRARKRAMRHLVFLAVFAAAVYGIYYFTQQMKEVDLKTAVTTIAADITTGNGFPVPVPDSALNRALLLDNMLVLIGNTNVYIYNDTGREVLNAQHGLSKIAVSTAGRRMLTYDNSGTRLNIFSRSALVHTETMPNSIYCADVGANGNYAVATGSNEVLAQVMVYNSRFEKMLTYYSARKPVITVSVADNKDIMLVGCIDTENGSYQSTIEKVQFNLPEPIAKVTLDGELLLKLEQLDDGNAIAMTDKRVILLNSRLGEAAEFRYDQRRLKQFKLDSDGRLLLILEELAGERENTLVLLSNVGLRQTASLRVASDLNQVAYDKSYIYVNIGELLQIYNLQGENIGVLPMGSLQFLQPNGQSFYCATNKELMCLDLATMLVDAGMPGYVASPSSNVSDKTSSGSSDGESKPASSQSDSSSGAADADGSSGTAPATEDTSKDASSSAPEEDLAAATSSETVNKPSDNMTPASESEDSPSSKSAYSDILIMGKDHRTAG